MAESFSVVDGVTRDLAKLPEDVAMSGLGASALVLAREMDDDNSATSKSMCANSLRDTLDRLRELAPPKRESDHVDDIARRRAKRLASGKSAA